MKKKRTECSCKHCVGACKHHPGSLMPGDLGRLARFFGITEQELFDNHIAVLDLGWVRIPFPAARYMPAGRVTKYADDRWDFHCRCHWLTSEDMCAVHPAKPTECAEVVPHKPLPSPHPRRVAVCQAWARPVNRRRLAKLLGEVD